MLLHEHKDFKDLIATVSDNMGIDPTLVEKDYWIMHCLWGLQQQGFGFELKGGTSLSKGFRLIHRFSESLVKFKFFSANLHLFAVGRASVSH